MGCWPPTINTGQWGRGFTDDKDEDTLQSGAHEHKDTCSQNNGRGNLFDHSQGRPPKHGERNEYEVDVGDDVGGKGYPDDGPGHGGLAGIWWLEKKTSQILGAGLAIYHMEASQGDSLPGSGLICQ